MRIALTAVFVYLLVLVNSRYFFHTELYETGDSAANTLSVLRAEHGQELYGPYSRWEFHHPGPALFYSEGWGEFLFYRALHLMPTPFNAQMLVVMGLLLSFFAAGISVAARWVRGGTFLALALALGALHGMAVDGRLLMMSAWSAHVIPLIFFCLLVAAASVGAGQGEDLPLLVLAGGFLVHLHVAQPLFVGPMFFVAYAGLWWSCWRRRVVPLALSTEVPSAEVDKEKPVAPVVTLPTASALPWRVYPRTHRFALLVACGFALPLLVDLVLPHNNLHQILLHLRTYKGERHPLLASVDYFLRFALYHPSLPGVEGRLVGRATPDSLLRLLLHHPEMTFLWAAALLSPFLPLAVRVWRGKDPVLLGGGEASTALPVGYAAPAGRWRFLGWLWIVWGLSVGLTLWWGVLQDGEMFYFNAWFNYSIWYVLALLAAGAVADASDALLFRSEHPWLWRGLALLFCAGFTTFALTRHPERFRADDGNSAENRRQHQTVANRLATEPAGTPRAKLLVFPHDAWQDATGIAVLLTRANRPAYVLPGWANMFGQGHLLPAGDALTTKPADTNPDYEVWHLVPAAASENPPSAFLLANYQLVPGGLPIDPATEPAMNWEGETANQRNYVAQGWSEGEDKTTERMGVVQFSPRPVPASSTVRITFDFIPFPFAKKHGPQRLVVRYNGNDLGTLSFAEGSSAPQSVVVPAAVWNRYSSTLLTLEFPDAATLLETGEGADPRPFAFLTHKITFALLTDADTTTAPAPTETAAPSPSPTPSVPEPSVTMPVPAEPPAPTPAPDAPTPALMPENTPSFSPTPEPTDAVPAPESTPEPSPTS